MFDPGFQVIWQAGSVFRPYSSAADRGGLHLDRPIRCWRLVFLAWFRQRSCGLAIDAIDPIGGRREGSSIRPGRDVWGGDACGWSCCFWGRRGVFHHRSLHLTAKCKNIGPITLTPVAAATPPLPNWERGLGG